MAWVAAEITQPPANGQVYIAVVDALPVCDLLLGQPAQIAGANTAGLGRGSDYVLVKFAPVPVPPLFVGKVLRLVVGLGDIRKYSSE